MICSRYLPDTKQSLTMIKLLFILLAVFTAVLLFRFNKQRQHKQAIQQEQVEITFDNQVICLRYPDGELRNLRWADLNGVTIRTNDAGPFATDLFWLLYADDKEPAAMFPGGASGESELLSAMQQRLAGFDNEQLIAAMGSTQNQAFTVWQRQAAR